MAWDLLNYLRCPVANRLDINGEVPMALWFKGQEDFGD